jgi:hypothetical protein
MIGLLGMPGGIKVEAAGTGTASATKTSDGRDGVFS